jgi:hypothetical protein
LALRSVRGSKSPSQWASDSLWELASALGLWSESVPRLVTAMGSESVSETDSVSMSGSVTESRWASVSELVWRSGSATASEMDLASVTELA